MSDAQSNSRALDHSSGEVKCSKTFDVMNVRGPATGVHWLKFSGALLRFGFPTSLLSCLTPRGHSSKISDQLYTLVIRANLSLRRSNFVEAVLAT